jgi:hypothetical protein
MYVLSPMDFEAVLSRLNVSARALVTAWTLTEPLYVQLLEVCEQPGQARDAAIPADVLYANDAPPHCQGIPLCTSL